MKLPTKDSLSSLVELINEKDYVENPDETLTQVVDFVAEEPVADPEKINRIASRNYVEPSLVLQKRYENQFRSFSVKKKKQESIDIFDSLI